MSFNPTQEWFYVEIKYIIGEKENMAIIFFDKWTVLGQVVFIVFLTSGSHEQRHYLGPCTFMGNHFIIHAKKCGEYFTCNST
jgi:hypothetical protein